MSIAENLRRINSQIPEDVKLVAVSKTYPYDIVLQAYDAGHRRFGENRVQELLEKQMQLPSDVEWHLIGHLQKNKVKYIVPFVALIHAVDSLELLETIQKEAVKVNRVIPCLIQIHIASEETKFGFSYAEAKSLFESGVLGSLNRVSVKGLMGMATFTDNQSQVRAEFRQLASFFRQVQSGPMKNSPDFNELSMGMSGDYPIAIEEGATIIRVGSAIFGSRN